MIVFPMSGLSSRFSKAGYLHNKYKLDLYGNSVFHHIVSQFKSSDIKDRFVFIHNGNDFDENFIVQTCKNVGLNTDEYFIVKLTGETRGQAETVFKGINTLEVKGSEQLIIYNIDSIRVDFNLPKEIDFLNVDGYLEVFKGEGTHWSFALPEDESSNEPFRKVTRVEEKNRISDYCSNGLYYFKSLDIFKEIYYKEVENFNENSELFVAPLYNTLIKDNKSVYMREIAMSDTIFCGTPLEYEEILSSIIPKGIVPSEKYIADEILSYTAEGISQKNYFKVMELLKSVHPSSAIESNLVFKALTVFFNFYGCYSRIVEYSHMHFTKFKIEKNYQKIYVYLRKMIIGFIKNSINIQHDNQKSANLMAVLITISGVDALEKHPMEFRKIAPYLSIPDHLKIFRTLRHKVDDTSFLDLIFNENNNFNSVSYLFILFCLSYRLENNEKYIKFIEKNIIDSRVLRKGDDERKALMNNSLSDTSKILFPPSSRNNIKVAVLITGQMRDYSIVSSYFSNLESEGISYDIYISTWNKSGQPPSHLGSLRGYDPKIRTAIKNRANKFMVSNSEFIENYHLKNNDSINEDMIRNNFKNLIWMKIDIEGETTNIFASNQDRLYFKVNQAYEEASKRSYDAYIRIRPDLNFLLDSTTLVNCIRQCVTNENLLFVRDAPLTDMYMPFLDDNFAIASPLAMKSYADLYNVSLLGGGKLPLDPIRDDIRPHSSLAYQLLLNKINVKFIKGIEDWKYNDIKTICATDYINYLRLLDKDNLNTQFIDSVIFKLRSIK